MLSENSLYLGRRRDETNPTGADTGRGIASNPALMRAFGIDQIEEEEVSQREEPPPVPASPEAITDENFMMYQRFMFKVSNWRAVTLLMSVFEASFLTLIAFIILYLRGNHVSLGLSTPPPTFIIYALTTLYAVFKLCWLAVLYLRSRRELLVML